jgi:predicted N-acetyltransferase YhbS
MMQVMFETLRFGEGEFDALIKGYYADTNAQEGITPLQMVWAFFRNLEAQDRLVIIGAREGAELLGFVMYMIVDHPQHGGMKHAMCNTLAVATKHRGKGIGSTLVEAAEVYFKTTKRVEVITHGFRPIYKVEPLFPKLGYYLAEQLYMKVL